MDFRDIKEWLIDTSKYIIVAVIVLIVAIYVVSLQQVVGPSMNPTLTDGDILILNKIHYRIFEVKRNDVVVLNYEASKYLIKRVIGLPGEKVEYRDNLLYIDNKSYTENIYDDMVTEDFKFSSVTELNTDTKDALVIPEDMYLVLGDNRGNSLDSREIGLIHKDDIIGKTMIKLWPFNDIKAIS